MNKKIIYLSLFLISVLFLISACSKAKDYPNSEVISQGKNLNCNVGHHVSRGTPFGIGVGKVVGIEDYKFINGETVSLCCDEVDVRETPSRKIKVCEGKNETGAINYRVAWEFNNNLNKYIKFEEYEPQFNAQCTYEFDETEKIKSRSCF